MVRSKEERFGLLVDLLGAGMKGLVLYTALLMTGFWMYQEGAGEFQPYRSMLIVPFVMILAYIYAKSEGVRCAALHIGAGIAWCILGELVSTNTAYFILAGIAAIGESLIHKFILGDTDKKRYAKRYRMQNYMKWGVMMGAMSVWLILYSNPATRQYPLEPKICGNFMIAAFAVYLFLITMMKYLFLQYDYFRQRDNLEQSAFRRMKRMNGIVAVLTVILIAIAVWLARETLVRIVGWLMVHVFGWLLGAGVLGLSKIQIRQLAGENSTVEGVVEGAPKIKPHADSQLPVEAIVIILLVIGCIYLLSKLYKQFAANYSIGGDEAVYISARTERDWTESKVRESMKDPHFSSDNRGKIRKIFYKYMNNKMDRSERYVNQSRTPKELTELYGKDMDEDARRDITDIYEKARYSDADCLDADVDKIKRLSHKK